MYQWRVTKYNPKYRNQRGDNKLEDWTSVSDIGSAYSGKVLTLETYLATEDKYIDAILYFMQDAGVSALFVIALEKDQPITERVDELGLANLLLEIPNIRNGEKISFIDQIKKICRLILRELMWAKLEDPGRFFVHFGHDYYMYIGSHSASELAVERTRKLGLFVEKLNSPYTEL